MKLTGRRIGVLAALTVLGVGLALYAGVFKPDAARGQTAGTDSALGITVTGSGSVKAAPDLAEFSFGVETQGQTADEALAKNNAAVQKVIAAIKGAGVAASDIQTQQVSVSPRYANDGQAITGYSAVNSVSAKIRNLSKAGAVVDAAVKAGANQVYGPTLSISEQSGLYQQALKKAYADARVKAQTIAAAAGVSLGRVVNIVEGGGFGPVFAESAAAGGDKGVPIEPGLQEIPANLTVTFAIS
jgi:uncharacterized protein YggE